MTPWRDNNGPGKGFTKSEAFSSQTVEMGRFTGMDRLSHLSLLLVGHKNEDVGFAHIPLYKNYPE
jgi:hypothetical protein